MRPTKRSCTRNRRKNCTRRSAKPRFPAATSWRRPSFCWSPETNLLRFAAGFGEDIARLRSIDISIVADTPEGSGVCGQAFRDQKLCISNDFLNDARSLAWRQGAAAGQVGAAAALPLTCNGRSVGVFLVTRREAGSIDAPDRLAARADVGEPFLCARQFRSRGRAQERRAGDAAAEPDVRRHQRDQRSHSCAPRPSRSSTSAFATPPSTAENPSPPWCCWRSRIRSG